MLMRSRITTGSTLVMAILALTLFFPSLGLATADASAGSAPDGSSAALSVVAAFQFGADYVGVAFSEKVNAAQATTAANYSFSPSLTISSVTLQDNGQTAIIKTSAALPKSTAYTLTVSGVTSLTGGALSGGTANFTTVAETVVNIATIQNATSTYSGQSVTMLGQVYITASSNGTTTSAFIQDGSGRGLNVFGGSVVSALDNLGNVVKVTGTIMLYFTTTEVSPFTATLIASGVPRLAPKVLTVAQMKSAAWEGTYIQTTATLSAAPAASGSSNYNYQAGDIIFRVRNATGINAANFASGDVVTAAGFGSAFGSGATLTYQIGVGNADEFTKCRRPHRHGAAHPGFRIGSREQRERGVLGAVGHRRQDGLELLGLSDCEPAHTITVSCGVALSGSSAGHR